MESTKKRKTVEVVEKVEVVNLSMKNNDQVVDDEEEKSSINNEVVVPNSSTNKHYSDEVPFCFEVQKHTPRCTFNKCSSTCEFDHEDLSEDDGDALSCYEDFECCDADNGSHCSNFICRPTKGKYPIRLTKYR